MIKRALVLSVLFIKLVSCETAYRLPNNSIPLRYDLLLSLNVESRSNFFEGQVRIHVKIVNESDTITVYSRDITIRKLHIIDLSENIRHENVKFSFEKESDFLIVKLPRKFTSNEEILLDVQYYGELIEASDDPNYNRGLVIGTYEEPEGTIENYIFTHFETIYARQTLPCYDEPGIRAPFSLQIEHHSSYNAISNMPVISQIPTSRKVGYVMTSFMETPKMQTYLLAFVITKMNYLQSNDLNVPQRVYARNARIDNGDVNYIVVGIDKIVKLVEDYFDVPFPIPKLDHFVAPHFYTAIENWGVIGYSERFLFNDDDRIGDVRTLIHEVVHQYIGNLVSPKWWTFVWLNEGFAKFFDLYFAKLALSDGTLNIDDYLKNQWTEIFMKKSQYTTPLNYYVEKRKDIEKSFSATPYYKGAAVIRMFHEAFGPETFRKGMSYYLKANQYSAVEPSDLHKAFQKAFDEDHPNDSIDLEEVMAPWENLNTQPTVKVSLENGTLRFSQSCAIQNVTFSIPIAYTTSDDPNFNDLTCKFWMTEREYQIDNFTADWILINIQQVGFFNVEYGNSLWHRIADQLLRNHSAIDYFHRYHLILSLSVPEVKLDIELDTKILNFIRQENEILVLRGAQNYLISYQNYLSNSRANQRLLNDTLEILYEKTKNDTMANYFKLLACKWGVKMCVDDSIRNLLDMLNKSKFDHDLNYCVIMMHVNETVYTKFFDYVKSVRSYEHVTELIKSLGCVRDMGLFDKFLHVFIDPEWISGDTNVTAKKLVHQFAIDTEEKKKAFFLFLERNEEEIKRISNTFWTDVMDML